METKFGQAKVFFVSVIYQKKKKKMSLLDINLIATNSWYDILRSKKTVKDISGDFTLLPYQSIWLTNKKF